MDPGDSIDWLWTANVAGTYEVRIPRKRKDYFQDDQLRRPIAKAIRRIGKSTKESLATALDPPKRALGLVLPENQDNRFIATIVVVPKEPVKNVVGSYKVTASIETLTQTSSPA